MQPDFWLQKWQDNQIPFHQHKVMPLLEKHWPALQLPAGSQVFVPLCGKSLDLAWLAAQGHRVLGLELSPLAVAQFFAEHGLTPQTRVTRYGTHYTAGAIELICGDVFDVDAGLLADCAGVYDRAALIALPEPLRARYVDEVYGRLPAHCRALLITLEYAQHERAGPPFSVDADEVQARYAAHWTIAPLERREILADEPRFAADGMTALHITVYRLQRR